MLWSRMYFFKLSLCASRGASVLSSWFSQMWKKLMVTEITQTQTKPARQANILSLLFVGWTSEVRKPDCASPQWRHMV